MHILHIHNTVIPVKEYGGIERIVWWLGKEQVKMGHKVTYLVPEGSYSPFAQCLPYDPAYPVYEQIPQSVDFVHGHFQWEGQVNKPHLISCHTNFHPKQQYHINTVFSSRDHAARNQSDVFVYNGVDIEEYGPVEIFNQRKHLLFMAYAKRPEKNLKGCKYIAKKTKNKLAVIGLKNKWFRRFSRRIQCKGFLGGEKRDQVIRDSSALLFPVLWHEPFGIAMIECLYFGCPVFGTTYGSLPEIITSQVGFLSNSRKELIQAVKDVGRFDRRNCHEYVCDQFTSKIMTQNYLKLYDKVLNGENLNQHPPVNGGNFNPKELLPFEK
ncbi:MAG: glycosyltransferase [Candidatus Omnitrophica bacterium]|nr:glycosyltransferase [Candidatus Omnitrophota bacterium]